jgi:outer membrane immunogenic protein
LNLVVVWKIVAPVSLIGRLPGFFSMTLKTVFTALAAFGLSASGALAADLYVPPATAPVAAPHVSAHDWTGLYVGAFAGYGWSTHVYSAPGLGSLSADGNGFEGGVRAGYDYDLGGAVLGLYGDVAASGLGTSVTVGPGTLTSTVDRIGTVQAKLGAPISDNLLIYAHGGYAYGHASQNVSAGGGVLASLDQSHNGWTIGAGLEVALTDNVSLTGEYSYYDFGSATIASGGGFTLDEHITANALTAGLQYRF